MCEWNLVQGNLSEDNLEKNVIALLLLNNALSYRIVQTGIYM